jgi:hypothetical protein
MRFKKADTGVQFLEINAVGTEHWVFGAAAGTAGIGGNSWSRRMMRLVVLLSFAARVEHPLFFNDIIHKSLPYHFSIIDSLQYPVFLEQDLHAA